MPDAKHPGADQKSPNEDAPQGSVGTTTRRRRLAFVGIIAGLMFGEAMVILLLAGGSSQGAAAAAEELEIGEFLFDRPGATDGSVRRARFRLHVRLLPDLRAEATSQFRGNPFHVREGVEEVLRRAAPSDFEDPLLADLKRRIQERLNQDLGQRAVARCIVTHLEIERNTEAAGAPQENVAKADPPLKSPESLLNVPENLKR
jgi:hypothetical protein